MLKTPEQPAVKDLVRRLRRELGLTQEQLAIACGLERTQVVLIETGRNKASSHGIRLALARGFGLDQVVLDAFLEGKIDLDAALRLRRQAQAS